MGKTRSLSPARQRRLDLFMARTWESQPSELTQDQINYQQTARENMNAHDSRNAVRREAARENYFG